MAASAEEEGVEKEIVSSDWPPSSGPLEAYDCEKYALKSSRVVLRLDANDNFEVVPAVIVVHNEKIVAIYRENTFNHTKWEKHLEVRDLGDLVILPGIIDSGARFGECAKLKAGSTSDCCQGFYKGTKAAAAGGITTTLDMASLDTEYKAANDIQRRTELAIKAGISVDLTLGVRLDDEKSYEPYTTRSLLRNYQNCGAICATAYLTAPSHATTGVEPKALAPSLGILPLLVDTVLMNSEELESSSPFHHLPYYDRLEAQSPLMLLPFYQVEATSPTMHQQSPSTSSSFRMKHNASPSGDGLIEPNSSTSLGSNGQSPTRQLAESKSKKKENQPRRTHTAERGRAFRRRTPPGSLNVPTSNNNKPRRQSSIWEVTCFSEPQQPGDSTSGFASPLETPPRELIPVEYGSPPREHSSVELSQAWVSTFLQAELDTYAGDHNDRPEDDDVNKKRRKTYDLITSSAPVSSKNVGLMTSPEHKGRTRRRSENDIHNKKIKGTHSRPSSIDPSGFSSSLSDRSSSKPRVNRILGSIPGLLRGGSPPRNRSPPRRKVWCGGSPEAIGRKETQGPLLSNRNTEPRGFREEHARSFSTMDEVRSDSNGRSFSTFLGSVSTVSRPSEYTSSILQDDTNEERKASEDRPSIRNQQRQPSDRSMLSSVQSFSMRSLLDALYDAVGGSQELADDDIVPPDHQEEVSTPPPSQTVEESEKKGKPVIASLSKGVFVELQGSETLQTSRRSKSISPPLALAKSDDQSQQEKVRFSPSSNALQLPKRRQRPAPIKIFKENDEHTRRAVRQDYSLYCDNHRSAAGADGLLALTDAVVYFDSHSPPLSPPPIPFFSDSANCCDGGSGTLSDDSDFDDESDLMGANSTAVNALHIARLSTQQETRVFEDCQKALTGNSNRSRNKRMATAGVACCNLFFCEEEVPYGATIYKVQPPIRHEAHRRALVRAVQDGLIQCVSSGHSPSHPAGKPCPPDNDGDFNRALPGTGYGANELLLPALWTALRRNDLTDLARVLSYGPARLLRLLPAKGQIAVKAHADFVIFDPDSVHTVKASHLAVPSPNMDKGTSNCLYEGKRLYGSVVATILRGRLVYSRGQFREEPTGNVITTKARIIRRASLSNSSACGIVVPTCGGDMQSIEDDDDDLHFPRGSDSAEIFQSEEAPTSTVPSAAVSSSFMHHTHQQNPDDGRLSSSQASATSPTPAATTAWMMGGTQPSFRFSFN